MGKKRKFNRFIRWIKSDLPEDKSVLLLGVTKIPSPTPVPRSRPHTLHLDHQLTAKSHTLDSNPRLKPRIFRSHSGDSLNELLTCRIAEVNRKQETSPAGTVSAAASAKKVPDARLKSQLDSNRKAADARIPDVKFAKKVSFDTNNLDCQPGFACFKNGGSNTKRFGFCTELPYDFYHPSFNGANDVTVPDIVMDKSVDSIGSCSLDVDASSTDFSDSSVGSSDCTLRSLGIPTPTTQPASIIPSFRIESTTVSSLAEPKKPSYLNLACTVNGYSNITNYDSKLRENFRISKSRDVSPIRPQDYHASIIRDPNSDPPKFLTPNYSKPLLTSPNMTESKSQTILRSSQTSSYNFNSSSTRTTTFVSKESKQFTSSMLYDHDMVDNASFAQKNGLQTKFSSFETSKTSHSSYMNVNGKASSISETAVQEAYTNGQQQNGQQKTKSFIQQRVERLYGPGALAQGFFITKRSKSRLSESENSDTNTTTDSLNASFNNSFGPIDTDPNLKQSNSSPALPVLRHLRPEFRAQLPIISPKRATADSTMQKSPTVPSLTTTNGIDVNSKILNGSKPIDNSVENKENIEKQIIVEDKLMKSPPPGKLEDLNSVKIIPEEIPAAPQVILPISKPEVAVVNGSDATMNGSLKTEVKDGHYFLKILKNETDRLISLAERAEAELEEKKTVLADDVLGYLRSASGKARLLVTQKMQQFEGLCHKNINQVEGEPFPTTPEDLQGFWDMVMLQVTQVDELFAELDNLKANNWVIPEKPKADVTDNATPKSKKVVVKKAISAEAEAQRKQREAARKKMIEEKRKAMRAKQSQAEQQTIEIFVPESS